MKAASFDRKDYLVSDDGTYFPANTDPSLASTIEVFRGRHKYRGSHNVGRLSFFIEGDRIKELRGYVGRSTGPVRIPLVIHNSRSLGGDPLPTDQIVAVADSRRKDRAFYYIKPGYRVAPFGTTVYREE